MIMFIVQNVAREWFTKAAVSFAQCAGGQYAVKGR